MVATYNRADRLPRLIAALAAQTLPAAEIVVVDDASPDGTAAVLSRLAAESGLPMQVLQQAVNAGPAAARNLGWRATSAPLVAFTDDDCVPQPGWLEALAAAASTVDIVQGRTVPDPAQTDALGPFSRTLDVPELNGFFQTCNVAYRREWLESTGGFDEQFRNPMGEDTDLAWRAMEAGAEVLFTPDAVVHHDVRPSSFLAQLRDTGRWEAVALVVQKHPAFRSRLHSHHFWKAAHLPVLLAAGGLLVAAAGRGRGVRLAGAALVAPYLRHRLVDAPLQGVRRRHRPLLLPAAFVLDAAEVAVLARASVRYRTLVL